LDRVFSEGDKPKKEDVKEHLMKYLEEAIDMSFGEEWNDTDAPEGSVEGSNDIATDNV
jgi:hypothetical protein